MKIVEDKIEALFRFLKGTSGFHSALLLTSDSDVYVSDDMYLSNDSTELKIFMKSTHFLDSLDRTTMPRFKKGHWHFEQGFLSLYSIAGNKLLAFHKNKLFWEKLDNTLIDFLLDI